MQFKDLIGQQKIKNQLNDLVQNNRLSHSLLFIGRDGSGSLPLSIAFAQYILCEKVHPDKKQEKSSQQRFKRLIPYQVYHIRS